MDRQKIIEALRGIAEEAKAVMMAVLSSELGVNQKVGRNTLVEGRIFQEVGCSVDDIEVVNILVNDYIQYIESGRQPGSFPPVNVIAKWAADKGITTDNRVVWAICQSIYKNGIPARPLVDVDGGLWSQIDDAWEEWADKIYNIITEDLDKEFKN